MEEIASKPSPLPPPPLAPPSYAGVAKKHLLVVKSTQNQMKATDKKEEISTALNGLQIVDARFGQTGNVVLNFENEVQRDEAIARVGNVDNLSARKTKKLLPKIMICNVNEMEDKDNLVETIIDKNDYLNAIDDVANKLEVVFEKKAAGTTKHFILRCHPDVRGLIHNKGDAIKLTWGIYKVRDRYFATMCYHCLKYGHIEGNCPNKDDDPRCKKCGSEHSTRDCNSTVKRCINCERAGKTDTNHFANETCCPILMNEIAKIKDRVDHGY